jgi:hypothetical protein
VSAASFVIADYRLYPDSVQQGQYPSGAVQRRNIQIAKGETVDYDKLIDAWRAGKVK